MKKNNNKIFITGVAGFIGFHLCYFLLKKNYTIYGIDNINNYYSTKIKLKRLDILKKFINFHYKKISINEEKLFLNFVKNSNSKIIIHLAAQPGVRYCYTNPKIYLKRNVEAFLNVLEVMRKLNLNKLIYASSSSVYGDAINFPTSENHKLNPINLYGGTKVFNEDMAKIYNINFSINSFGLRFFTAYGSLGRPDMMIAKSIKKIKKKKIIDLYNKGNHSRDFTHVSTIVDIICGLINKIEKFKGINNFNICSGKKIPVKKLLKNIGMKLGVKPKTINIAKQKGDMLETHGDNKKIKLFLKRKIRFTSLDEGLEETINPNYD